MASLELDTAEDEGLEYYTLLNISSQASPDEIRSAYRRLCRIYHPDRHQEPQKQASATNFFRKIQEAYNVLIDPRTRAIYDRSGKKGLEDDVAIALRTSLPSELMEEYDRLKSLWEERTYIQKTKPQGNFEMSLDCTGLVDGTNFLNPSPVAVKKIFMQQSVDADMTQKSFGNITGIVNATQRMLFGGLQFSLRQLLDNQNWVKVSVLAGSQPALGLDTYHTLASNMYVTTQSALTLNQGSVMFGGSGSITRRLNNKTMGTLSINQNAENVSTQVVHNFSERTSFQTEVRIGQESSHLKGAIAFKPVPKYTLSTGVKVSTKGGSLFCGAEEEIATLTRLSGTVLVGQSEGVVLKLVLMRASMRFQVKIQISKHVSLTSLLYATLLPLGLYGALRVFAIAPFLKNQLLKELNQKREEMKKEIIAKKAEAEEAVELMQESFQRIVGLEQARQGLIIVEAWYGKLFDFQESANKSPDQEKIVNVCVPLQCMVQDSKLILHESTKANIPGFYDPCIGEKKYLRVRYEFRGAPHEVTIDNSEPLIIPRRSHRIAFAE